MPDDETPADRLRSAALRVRAGWTRGVLVNEAGQRCALGAILNAQMDVRRSSQTMELLAGDATAWEAVKTLHGFLTANEGEHTSRMYFASWCTVDNIEEWNDGGGMTGLAVAEVMEKAAARREESGA